MGHGYLSSGMRHFLESSVGRKSIHVMPRTNLTQWLQTEPEKFDCSQTTFSLHFLHTSLSPTVNAFLRTKSCNGLLLFPSGTLFREVCYRVTGSHKQLLSFDVAVEAERAQDKSFANLVVSVALLFSNLLLRSHTLWKETDKCPTVHSVECCGFSWRSHMTHLNKLIKIFSSLHNSATSIN